MPIPLGILAAAGVRAAGGSYEHIQTYNVGSSGSIASVSFNVASYASTYQHLQIRAVVSAANTAQWMNIGFNEVTSAGSYYSHFIRGTGSAVNSFASGGEGLGAAYMAKFSSNPTAAVIDILDPFEAKNKTVRALTGNATAETFGGPIMLWSGQYMSTSSVTSVEIYASSTTFNAGSRISIYGLKAS